jgi:hypothetical protein
VTRGGQEVIDIGSEIDSSWHIVADTATWWRNCGESAANLGA